MKIVTSIHIDSDLLDKLREIAKKQERSINFLIVKSIEEIVKTKSHE
jgi:predicted transcriptional regulator